MVEEQPPFEEEPEMHEPEPEPVELGLRGGNRTAANLTKPLAATKLRQKHHKSKKSMRQSKVKSEHESKGKYKHQPEHKSTRKSKRRTSSKHSFIGLESDETETETTQVSGPSFLQTVQRHLQRGQKDCMDSCGAFEESLARCLATILFEPGRIATMGGAPGSSGSEPFLGAPSPAMPPQCSGVGTNCVPDLPIQYQRCVSQKPLSQCALLKDHMDECKDCPQLSENSLSEYHTFVGGCMDQLNAYWQATHPMAKTAALPRAGGCDVHR